MLFSICICTQWRVVAGLSETWFGLQVINSIGCRRYCCRVTPEVLQHPVIPWSAALLKIDCYIDVFSFVYVLLAWIFTDKHRMPSLCKIYVHFIQV
jgi:hypothetical protein